MGFVKSWEQLNSYLLRSGNPTLQQSEELIHQICIQIKKDTWSFQPSSSQAWHLHRMDSFSLFQSFHERNFLDKHNYSHHLSFPLLQVTPYHSACKKALHTITWDIAQRVIIHVFYPIFMGGRKTNLLCH